MFPLYDYDEFSNTNEDYDVDDLIILFNESDRLYKLVQKAPLSEGYLWVACHSSDTSFGVIFYLDGEEIYKRPLTSEYVSDSILNSGLWNGQEIVFLSCSAGKEGGPAEEVSQRLGTVVYAPCGNLFFKENGFFYVSDYELPIGHTDLSKDIQQARWRMIENGYNEWYN